MDGRVVVGRAVELDSIEAFLGDVLYGPVALLLAGEVGIGKTILWEAGVEEAERRFGRVLTCRGVETEASLSFAALSELLAPVLSDAMPSLAAPRRRALEVALSLAEPALLVPDVHVIGLAVLDVLDVLATSGAVVVAIDDLQWVDLASASVLQVALRRLRDEPVGLLATVRTSPAVATPIELERGFPGGWLRRLPIGPLSVGALHHLLRGRVGLDLSRPDLLRVNEATAGNPFFAIELGRELGRLGTRRLPEERLPVSSSLGQLLGARLARLPADVREVLVIAALAARPTVDMVSAAYGERQLAIELLDHGVREGVVEVTGSRVRFAHPLFASVLHDGATPDKRRELHRTLARLASDVEERARHRARSIVGPDSVVAAELNAAAEHAAARGATATGAELCEYAAELTPSDPPLARQRWLRAARFHRLAGDAERAGALLTLLLEQVPSGLERSDIVFELAMTVRYDVRLIDEAVAEAGDDDSRAARILSFGAGLRLFETHVQAALVDGRGTLETAERVGDPLLIAAAISQVGFAEGYAGEATPGLLERGAELEERLDLSLEWFASPRFALARVLMRFGEMERCRAIFADLESKAIARGDEVSRVPILWASGMLEWLAGRWSVALEHVATAQELTDQMQSTHGQWWVARVRAPLEADVGLVEQARASAGDSLRFAESSGNEFYTVLALGAFGRLEIALGNNEAAGQYLRELPDRLHARGIDDPTVPVWADTIETMIALGELERARAPTSSCTRSTPTASAVRGRSLQPPAAVVCSAPRTASLPMLRPPWNAPWQRSKTTPIRSSAPGRCSPWEPCGDERSRRDRPGRRSNKPPRSSTNWAPVCGVRRHAARCVGSAVGLRRQHSSRRLSKASPLWRLKVARTVRSRRNSTWGSAPLRHISPAYIASSGFGDHSWRHDSPNRSTS